MHGSVRFVLIAAAAIGLSTAASPNPPPPRSAVFAGGCFWTVEYQLEGVRGVRNVVSGFAGGHFARPTYENHPGHLEAVRVTYDPTVISYPQLVRVFLRGIDPTERGGQVCDRGPSYQTAIFAATPSEDADARLALQEASRTIGRPVATQVRAAARFWPAEQTHQDFARTNPTRYRQYDQTCRRGDRLRQVWRGVT